MDEDLMARMNTAIDRLQKRSLALSHPNKNDDMAEVFMALALIMQAQVDLARAQRDLLTRP
jgi:hypothetical protein